MTELVPLKDCPPGVFWYEDEAYLKPLGASRPIVDSIEVFLIQDGSRKYLPQETMVWSKNPDPERQHICNDICGWDTEGDLLAALAEAPNEMQAAVRAAYSPGFYLNPRKPSP